MSRPLPLVVIICLVSCSPHAEEARHSFRVYEEDRVTIFESTGGSRYTGELFDYEQVLVLDEDPEVEESLLYGPSHFLMDEDGFFYVADRGNGRIAVFDPKGRYSHSFGREGSGPGEFRQMEIQSVSYGILTVWDFAQRRTTRFHTDGRLLDVTPLPPTTARQILGLSHAPDDRLVVLELETPADGDYWEYERSHATVFNSRGDSLWSCDFGWVKSRFVGTRRAGDLEYQWPIYFHYGPRPWCAYDRRGTIAYTSGVEPVVDVFNLDGMHVKQIRLGLDPDYPTREDGETARAFLRETVERNAGSPTADNWQSELENILMPEQKAFWHRLEVDDAGFIWLLKPEHRFAIFDDTITLLTWFLISPDGEYLGQTRRPKDARARISRGHLLEISSDRESGELSLIVYAIHPAVHGLEYP